MRKFIRCSLYADRGPAQTLCLDAETDTQRQTRPQGWEITKVKMAPETKDVNEGRIGPSLLINLSLMRAVKGATREGGRGARREQNTGSRAGGEVREGKHGELTCGMGQTARELGLSDGQ